MFVEASKAAKHNGKAKQAKLNELNPWLEVNDTCVLKDSLARKAMKYTLNQWPTLVGYCERGDLQISNVLAENAILPFALGRKAWLFADTPQGARASATCYSLIETAKANQLVPAAYIQHVLEHIAEDETVEALEQLLPWNVSTRPEHLKLNTVPCDPS